jgi:hypothetical protein
MSRRLRRLEKALGKHQDMCIPEQLSWLNHKSFRTDGSIGPAEWEDTLNTLAYCRARGV